MSMTIMMTIMMIMMMSHLFAVKGASSGGRSLCPGRMPRVDSSSCTEAMSALRPFAANSLGMYMRDSDASNNWKL